MTQNQMTSYYTVFIVFIFVLIAIFVFIFNVRYFGMIWFKVVDVFVDLRDRCYC